MKYIASCSFGKDSLAMVLRLIEENRPLDMVIFYDTGMEFQAIYNMRDKIRPILEKNNIEYVELHPENTFEYDMFERPIYKRGTKIVHKYGYSWCGSNCRWGTTFKTKAIKDFYKQFENEEVYEYVGIALDEPLRLPKDGTFQIVLENKIKSYPLAEWGMTEKDCLDYCYAQGYDWLEYESILKKNVRLYDILPRVSCWCCRNKNLDELRNYYHYLPSYWNKLKEIQSKLPCDPMKKASGSVFDLEKRFMLEDKWIVEGREKEIRSKKFFEELKTILKEK